MEFSKKLLIGIGSLFIFCILAVIGLTIFGFDMTIMGPAWTTAVCGLLGISVREYYKKSQAENIVKLKTELYKTAVDENLRYDEGKAAINQKYNTSEDMVCSPIEQMKQEALGSLSNTIDRALDDATSSVESSEY